MGSRGVYSYSANHNSESIGSSEPLTAYAAASLNAGTAKGTNPSKAIERFREQMMNRKVEYSAYIDENGYIHALGSTGKEGSTKVASLEVVSKQKGVNTIIHNHPHGGSDGRTWGGTFSEADLKFISGVYSKSGGKVNKIVATSREGTYTATVKKKVSISQASKAYNKAKKAINGKKFTSKIAVWRALNSSLAKEFGKIGIDIKLQEQTVSKKRLVTQKIGIYET